MSNTVVTIGAPSGQTQVSVSSADIIYVTVAAGFTGQGGGGGGANLSTTRTATTVTVVSDSGTDATIAAADGTNAGVMTAAMKTKLDGIEAGAEVNDSASEILTKLLTVDGSGSNLDADTLDGNHAGAFAAVSHTHVIGDVTNLQTTLDGKVDENAAITGATKTKITYDAKGLVTAGADAAIADITGLQTALDGKVASNAAITGATKTKITYDAKGLVTAGADATTADIADSTDKRYVTEAEKTKLANTSGTNTGDQTITLTGDVTGSGTGSFAATIASNAVTNAKLAQVATATFKGRTTAGSGDPEDLTATQATALLNNFTSTLKGLAPASGGGTTNFLRADGTWAAPAGGGAGDATTLYENFTQVGVANSTTKTAIVSYTLPTDLAAGDMIEIHMTGTYKNNSGASRNFNITHELGTTTMLTQAVSLVVNADERTWNGVARLYIVSTTSQRYGYFGLGSVGAVGTMATASTASIPMNGTGYGTAAETLTSAKTYQVAVTFATASADLFLYCQAVKIVKIAAA